MIKKQVTSLELARELEKADYSQEGIWWWDLIRKKEDCDVGDKPKDEWVLSYEECYHGDEDDLIVAPTVAELGERLPQNIKVDEFKDGKDIMTYRLQMKKHNEHWSVHYYHAIDVALMPSIIADTEANARAKMWLYLKKEGLIK